MLISIEIPVFRGGFLQPAIDSVLAQSSEAWELSLLWDGGDEQSRTILERVQGMQHPRVHVHFDENRGIARARRYLTANSRGDYILPLDDDDVIPKQAVEKFLACAREKPWASLIRARRQFIDTDGNLGEADPWFPFGPRSYQLGMVKDLFNQAQPYLIRRGAYARTTGWEGFPDFMFAGEDCDIFLKLEEVAPIELLDEVLYYYRIHPNRTSESLKQEGGFEMWRRLADKTIARIGLPVARTNEIPPFAYERTPVKRPARDMIEFVIPVREAGAAATSGRAVASLLRCGFAEDAIHRVDTGGGWAKALNAGFALTSRPLVCFLDGEIDVGDAGVLDALLLEMHERGVDLAGPRFVAGSGAVTCSEPCFDALGSPLERGPATRDEEAGGRVVEVSWLPGEFLLARREVVNAVGGFHEEYVGDALADVDFSLTARQRDFKCLHVGTVEVTRERPAREPDAPRNLEAFHRKWRVQAHLLGLSSP